MINTVLWDVDATLLDFEAAERAAVKSLFREFNIGECTDEMIKDYSIINRRYWERLERGEIDKPKVLVGRFEEFFELIGVDKSIAGEFNSRYQLALGDTIVYCDDSLNIIKSLKSRVKQYVVSNGTIIAQNKKLRLSGLGELMDGIFLSEELGVEKPNKKFFDKVFEKINKDDPSLDRIDKDNIIIVGDSLTSDIKGGNNAGIRTCWYNPKGLEASDMYRIDYEIRDLHEIYNILGINEL